MFLFPWLPWHLALGSLSHLSGHFLSLCFAGYSYSSLPPNIAKPQVFSGLLPGIISYHLYASGSWVYIPSPGISLKSHIWPPTLSTGMDATNPTSLQWSPDLSLHVCTTHSLLYLRSSIRSLPPLLGPKSRTILDLFRLSLFTSNVSGNFDGSNVKTTHNLTISHFLYGYYCSTTNFSLLNHSKAPDFPLWAAILTVVYTVLSRWVWPHGCPCLTALSIPAPGPSCCFSWVFALAAPLPATLPCNTPTCFLQAFAQMSPFPWALFGPPI